MKPRIQLVLAYSDGREVVAEAEGDSITPEKQQAAEDLLHTLWTGERPLITNFYDLCATAFDTTREDAKRRVIAASYGKRGKALP